MSLNRTPIEWVKNPDGTQGYTLNPITGCLNHTPEGLCLGGLFPCYAYKLANGRLKPLYLANKNIPPLPEPQAMFRGKGIDNVPLSDPFYPRFWAERLSDPLAKVVPTKLGSIMYGQSIKGIFVCDMGELFGDWIPREWQDKVFDTIRDCESHRFYLLTKQPSQLIKFSPFPPNCFVGVSVTTWDKLMEARFALHDIKAKVKYISFEPLLTEMRHLHCLEIDIDWVIIGAQTKPYKPPEISWVEEIVRACDRAGIPVFLKDNLKPLLKNTEGWTPAWAVSARECNGTEYLRQELPK